MKPKSKSKKLLSISQSITKMIEFHVPEENRNLHSTKKPEKLFSLAIALLGDYARVINTDYDNPQKKEFKADLIYSAEFFESYANSHIFENPIYELLIGATTYYLCDLPGSCRVLIDRIPLEYTYEFNCDDLDKLLFWLLKGDYTKKQNSLSNSEKYNEYFLPLQESLQKFFIGNYQESNFYSISANLRRKAYNTGNPRELLFSELIAAVVKEKIVNSSINLLPNYSDLSISTWLPIINNGIFIKELWPSQKLLGENGVFKGQSAVIQMPTSSGKTKSIEIIIRSSFFSNRTEIAVIVAPFKALCSEISEELRLAFSEEKNIDINQLNDAFESSEKNLFYTNEKKHILIVTPEKLYYLLSIDKTIANTINLIIFDEGHQFDNGSRGITYELLITELKILLPENAQKILISAVIHNAESIANWLFSGALTITSNYVPTKKNIGFIDFDMGPCIRFIDTEDFSEKYFVPRILPNFSSENTNYLLRSQTPTNISLFMGFQMVTEGSVAIFCGQKKSVTKMMKDVTNAIEKSPTEFNISSLGDSAEIHKIASLCVENLGEKSIIAKSTKNGIFPHHADLPKGIRVSIEHGMRCGKIKYIICTSTLAQGVNLPIKYMFVINTYQAGGAITVRDFNNLIGRVGRAGKLTEGCIIFCDRKIYEQRNDIINNYEWRRTKSLLNPNETEDCLSNLLKLLHFNNHYGSYLISFTSVSILLELYEKKDETIISDYINLIKNKDTKRKTLYSDIEKQLFEKFTLIEAIENFLMLLGNDLSDEKVTAIAKETLAFSLADDNTKEMIIELFKELRTKIISKVSDSSVLPILAKSLTGINKANDVKIWLENNISSLKMVITVQDFVKLLWPLILQTNTNSYFNNYEDKNSLYNALNLWIEGIPYYQIFDSLPKKKVNKRDLITIEHVINIFENGFGYDVPILINCITELLSLTINDEEKQELSQKMYYFQKIIKYGLPNKGSILLYEEGFCDRCICQKLNKITENCDNRPELYRQFIEKQNEIEKVLNQYPSYFTIHFNSLMKI